MHKGPPGMVYLERAGCTLPWASHWMQTTMGPRTAMVLEGGLKVALKVQHKMG